MSGKPWEKYDEEMHGSVRGVRVVLGDELSRYCRAMVAEFDLAEVGWDAADFAAMCVRFAMLTGSANAMARTLRDQTTRVKARKAVPHG